MVFEGMKRKVDITLLLVLLALSIIPLYYPTVVYSGDIAYPRNSSITHQHDASSRSSFFLAKENFSLTWTSRWSTAAQRLSNESKVVGDHVILNATFIEDLNVTRSEVVLFEGI